MSNFIVFQGVKEQHDRVLGATLPIVFEGV